MEEDKKPQWFLIAWLSIILYLYNLIGVTSFVSISVGFFFFICKFEVGFQKPPFNYY